MDQLPVAKQVLLLGPLRMQRVPGHAYLLTDPVVPEVLLTVPRMGATRLKVQKLAAEISMERMGVGPLMGRN